MTNILFIFSDQHRPQSTGCYGDDLVRTPNLDALAARGVRFDNAYCNNPLCCPSRASLMTGKYSRDLGIYENQDVLEPYSVTFPRVLNAAGYRTCLIGKQHFNGEQFHGFQDRPYGDFFGQGHQPDPRRSPELGDAGLGHHINNNGPTQIPLPLTQTEICVAEASKWIQVHAALSPNQPFCLCVNFDKPHFPIRPPAAYYEHYRGRIKPAVTPSGYYDSAVLFVQRSIDCFGYGPGSDETGALESYYGCIEWVDDAIGRLLAVLDYYDMTDDTLVIYSSDHGELGGDHGLWNKTVFFENSARVPLIAAGAGVSSRGSSVSEPVSLVDLFPTFCDLANAPTPEQCAGQSLLPLMQGDGGSWTRDAIFCETALYGSIENAGCMIRSGKWKYNYYLDGGQELYDMEADPGEWNNLAKSAEHASTAATFRRRVIDFWEPEKQLARSKAVPKVSIQKHNYPFSNQFLLGTGTIIDARP